MIKHCNKIHPDCSCCFMPCNILLFASTIKVYQKNQTWMGQCERGWSCAGRIFSWQQRGWVGCCQKINLTQGQSFCQKPSFGFPGRMVPGALQGLEHSGVKICETFASRAQIQIEWNFTGSSLSDGPRHNGGSWCPFNWWPLFRRGLGHVWEQEQVLQGGDWS